MTTRKTKRIGSIQACRGIAALLVVLDHLSNVELKYCSTQRMRFFAHGAVGVDLFFVISGVVIASVIDAKSGDRSYPSTFLFHRFARIFPVYWCYTTIVLVALLCNPNWINQSSGHQVNIVASYLLIPTAHGMLVAQGYTLSFEIYFYLVIALLLMLAPKKNFPWILGIWGIAVCAVAAFWPPSQPVLQVLINPEILEFLAGFAIFQIYRRSELPALVGKLVILSALLWLTCIIIWHARVYQGSVIPIWPGLWSRPALYGSFSALFILGAVELDRSGLVRYFKPLIAIGDWSYSIYLSHIIVVEAVGRFAYRFMRGTPGLIFLVDLVSIPCVLGVGYLSYAFLERPLMDFVSRRNYSGLRAHENKLEMKHT